MILPPSANDRHQSAGLSGNESWSRFLVTAVGGSTGSAGRPLRSSRPFGDDALRFLVFRFERCLEVFFTFATLSPCARVLLLNLDACALSRTLLGFRLDHVRYPVY
jgi:hypothetical protein